jgi:hypothetical protein
MEILRQVYRDGNKKTPAAEGSQIHKLAFNFLNLYNHLMRRHFYETG